MKKHVTGTVCLLLIISSACQAQVSFTWKEFFKQKKTEKKYLAEHIVQLQAYLTLVKQGYRIVEQGAETVRHVKNGEFDLHDAFYLSHQLVNPALGTLPATASIAADQAFIARACRQLLQKSRDHPGLSDPDRDYIAAVVSRLGADMAAGRQQTHQLLSDYQLSMNDDERMRQLSAQAAYWSKRVAFIKEFFSQVISLGGQRIQEQIDIGGARTRFGVQ